MSKYHTNMKILGHIKDYLISDGGFTGNFDICQDDDKLSLEVWLAPSYCDNYSISIDENGDVSIKRIITESTTIPLADPGLFSKLEDLLKESQHDLPLF